MPRPQNKRLQDDTAQLQAELRHYEQGRMTSAPVYAAPMDTAGGEEGAASGMSPGLAARAAPSPPPTAFIGRTSTQGEAEGAYQAGA